MNLEGVFIGGWLYFPIVAIVMIIFGLIGWVITKENKVAIEILNYMISEHLDEWEISQKEIIEAVSAPKREVKKALKTLLKRGVMYRGKHGFALLDPLVFLTRQGYSRARRLTKDDNLLYGAYQYPYKTNIWYLFSQSGLGIVGGIFIVLTYFDVFNLRLTLESIFGVHPLIAALFIFGVLILFADVFNNFLKYWTRERYSVVIGEKSGISYDTSSVDELSGRIERHAIEDVDIDLTWGQKIVSSFKGIPIGNLRVWKEGSDEEEEPDVTFENIPYPREAFYLVRGIQLGALEWRKKHAKDISHWKSGAQPTFS